MKRLFWKAQERKGFLLNGERAARGKSMESKRIRTTIFTLPISKIPSTLIFTKIYRTLIIRLATM